jgi:hypothetical protein
MGEITPCRPDELLFDPPLQVAFSPLFTDRLNGAFGITEAAMVWGLFASVSLPEPR